MKTLKPGTWVEPYGGSAVRVIRQEGHTVRTTNGLYQCDMVVALGRRGRYTWTPRGQWVLMSY